MIRIILSSRLQPNETNHRFASWSPSNEKSSQTPEKDSNKPIPFFGTPAHLTAGPNDDVYQPKSDWHPNIVMASVAIFLIYFCILREENDIDDLLRRDLYDHFGGESGEAAQLKKAYDYNIKNGFPVTEIIRRLRDIGAPIPPGYNPERTRK